MNPLYLQALNGTLASPAYTGDSFDADIYNDLAIPVSLYCIDDEGEQWLNVNVIAPMSAVTWSVLTGNYYLIKTANTGAFVTVMQMIPNTFNEFYTTYDLLCSPNDIGPYPAPDSEVPVPADSPRVLVGYGPTPSGGVVAREQYWKRLGDSYVISPGTHRTVSTTVFSGVQTTASEQTTFAAALGLSASATWGAISASISASLSAESTTFQQVLVTNQVTQYESLQLNNTTDAAQMYVRWQLTDVLTAFDGNGSPVSTLVSGESPVLVDGPLDPANLPAPPQPAVSRLPAPQSRKSRYRRSENRHNAERRLK